jgi:hypothetical protein
MRHKLFVVSVFIVLISSTIGGMVASKVLTNEQARQDQMKEFTAILDTIESNYVERIPSPKVNLRRH